MVDADHDDGMLYGEDLAAYIAQMRAKAEAFFAQAGQDPMEIYRIEQFEPVKIDPEFHGKFYQGDSYVVLKRNRAAYDIHYWHGKEATSDEMGSSAALSVQLSANLTLDSRHHLEEQGFETDLFMTYFAGGVFYLEGGVESGFRHVEPEVYVPTLMHIKGKRYPRVFTVPLSGASLNDGDCFVLDLGLQLYCWYGSQSNLFERRKASQIAEAIRTDDRKMKATLFFLEGANEEIQAAFWEGMGGRPDSIAPAMPDVLPSGTEEERLQYKLWHVSDDSGSMETTEVTDRPLKREHLIDSDSYLLELYDQIYVWQGKDASTKEKYAGMKIAKDFAKKHNKPQGTKISRVPALTEDAIFKSFFTGFYQPIKEDFGTGALAASTQASQDMAALAAQQMKAKALMFDKLGPLDGVTKTVYVVNDDLHSLTEITDPRESGIFFAESCYVLYLKSAKHEYFINWLGPRMDSRQVTSMSEAMLTIVGGILTLNMTHIRVKKGHEDEAFLSWFPDGFLILDEARVSMEEWQTRVNSFGSMMRVQAPFGDGARAIEQNELASQYLNSGDSVAIVLPAFAGAFVWKGCGSNDTEKSAAERAIQLVSSRFCGGSLLPEVMAEGEEAPEFWDSIGGQGEYSRVKELLGFPPGFEPRLFNVSNASGYMWMQECPAFAQEDLLNEDCFILDAYNIIYMWIGNQSNKFEKKGVVARAEKYLNDLNDSRDKGNVIFEEVLAGREPPAFTVQFIQWEPEVAAEWLKTDATVVAAVAEEAKAAVEAAVAAVNPFEGALDPNANKFSYEVLKSSFPSGVKPTAKEYYLSDEEFAQYIGQSKADWDALQQWKRDRKKKELGLF